MYLILCTLLVFPNLVISTPLDLVRRSQCNANFDVCDPSGVESMIFPPIGSDMSSLYVDLLDSVAGIHFTRQSLDAEATDTLLVPRGEEHERSKSSSLCYYKIPFCYDRFTTNYVLPDGSYGSITTGDYTAADGSHVNLVTGEYVSNGATGNIYGSDASAKPDLATLSIPPQWTATGVGSAIPIAALGKVAVYTTTVPATTLMPAASPSATVVRGTMISELTLSGSVVSPTTFEDSTVQASIVPASTDVEAKTIVITSTVLAVASSKRTGMGSSLEARVSAMSALFLAVPYIFLIS